MSLLHRLKEKIWDPCLADPGRGIAFFDGFTFEGDPLADPRPDKTLSIIEDEQVLLSRLILEELAGVDARENKICLDLGTGNGVFAVVAASCGVHSIGIDSEKRAIRYARYNKLKNLHKLALPRCGPEFYVQDFDDLLVRGTDSGKRFDYIFANLPFNPTANSLNPVGLATAGEDGQDMFRMLLTKLLPSLLKVGGKCLGLHLLLSDESGAPDRSLTDSSRGFRLHYAPIIDECPIPADTFVKTTHRHVDEEHIEGMRSALRGKFFSYIVYEIVCLGGSDIQTPVIIEKSPTLPRGWRPEHNSWDKRLSYHKTVIDNAGSRSFPGISLFTSNSILPPDKDTREERSSSDCPDAIQEHPSQGQEVEDRCSILKGVVDEWLNLNGFFAPDDSPFSAVFVDAVPWYLVDGSLTMRNESALWVADTFGQGVANFFLEKIAEAIQKLHASGVSPLSHPFRQKLYQSSKWLPGYFLLHDLSESSCKNLQSLYLKWAACLLDDFKAAQPDTDGLRRLVEGIQSHSSQGGRSLATLSQPLPRFGFTMPLSEPEMRFRRIESDLVRLCQQPEYVNDPLVRKLAECPEEDERWQLLNQFDFDACFEAVHHVIDGIFEVNESDGKFSILGSLPLALWNPTSQEGESSRKSTAIRGFVYLYLVGNRPWSPGLEALAKDLLRLVSICYEDDYALRATDAYHERGVASERASFAHVVSTMLEAYQHRVQRQISNDCDTLLVGALIQATINCWRGGQGRELDLFSWPEDKVDGACLLTPIAEMAIRRGRMRLDPKPFKASETYEKVKDVGNSLVKYFEKCQPEDLLASTLNVDAAESTLVKVWQDRPSLYLLMVHSLKQAIYHTKMLQIWGDLFPTGSYPSECLIGFSAVGKAVTISNPCIMDIDRGRSSKDAADLATLARYLSTEKLRISTSGPRFDEATKRFVVKISWENIR